MAFIHLNIKFSTSDVSANIRCVETAIAMIKLLDDVDLARLEMLPPTIAVGVVVLHPGWVDELSLERLADRWTSVDRRDNSSGHHGGAVV